MCLNKAYPIPCKDVHIVDLVLVLVNFQALSVHYLEVSLAHITQKANRGLINPLTNRHIFPLSHIRTTLHCFI